MQFIAVHIEAYMCWSML